MAVSYIAGLPAVITMAAHIPDKTTDDIPITEALKRLEDQGAAVVGLNCSRGPAVMMPLMREIRKVCKVMFVYSCRTQIHRGLHVNGDMLTPNILSGLVLPDLVFFIDKLER